MTNSEIEQLLKEQTINKSGIKKLKYYKNYPVENQKKFLDLIASGIDYEEALKESQLDKECLEDWIYEDNKVVDSDVKKGWEDIEGELCINGEYHVNICYVNAACYDYDPFKELYIAVEKIDKEAEFKNCLNWIEEQKKKFENDFEKFAEFVYTEYNVKGSK